MEKGVSADHATGISGVTGAVGVVGASTLGGAGIRWWWAIGFAVVVLTLGLVLEYRRSLRELSPG